MWEGHDTLDARGYSVVDSTLVDLQWTSSSGIQTFVGFPPPLTLGLAMWLALDSGTLATTGNLIRMCTLGLVFLDQYSLKPRHEAMWKPKRHVEKSWGPRKQFKLSLQPMASTNSQSSEWGHVGLSCHSSTLANNTWSRRTTSSINRIVQNVIVIV